MPIASVGDAPPSRYRVRDDDGPFNPDTVTATLYDPVGATTSLSVQHPGVGEFLAFPLLTAPGTWRVRWQSAGNFDDVADETFIAVDAPMSAPPPWAPTLRDVAAHIPTRTRALRLPVPDLDEYVGTFTAETTPTDEEATSLIQRACAWVAARVGAPLVPQAYPLCAVSAALWAAYWIELAYPERDADLQVYDRLRTDAKDAMAQARDVNIDAGGGASSPDPDLPVAVSYSFPAAPGWADHPFL